MNGLWYMLTENKWVLIDAFDCVDNQLCAVFEIELIYKPRDVITIPVVVHVVH